MTVCLQIVCRRRAGLGIRARVVNIAIFLH